MVARRALPVPPRRCAPYSAILLTRSVCVVGSRGAIPALYGRYERGGARAAAVPFRVVVYITAAKAVDTFEKQGEK